MLTMVEIANIPTGHLYLGLLALVAVQRLNELRIAAKHRRSLLARGGREFGSGHYPWMVALHASFLVACACEVVYFDRRFIPVLAVPMFGLLVGAGALRAWVMRTLGERWTTRVIVVSGWPRVESGPYRFMRHPNYLAVVTEVFALPLIHTAWITALVWSSLNAMLLHRRIRIEEAALRTTATGDSLADMEDRSR